MRTFAGLLARIAPVLLGFGVASVSAATQPFATGSFESIIKSRHGQPFALVFWSVECAPCIKELTVLAEARKRHPATRLVLVSTDELSSRPKVDEMLARQGLDGVESWIFSDANSNRLRYQVDPNWYGELPRSYFYDAQHRRVSHSGGITTDRLEFWLQSVGR